MSKLLKTVSPSLPISGLAVFSGDPTVDDLVPQQKASDNTIARATIAQLFGSIDGLPVSSPSAADKTLVVPLAGEAQNLNVVDRLTLAFSPLEAPDAEVITGEMLWWSRSVPGTWSPATATEPAMQGSATTSAGVANIFSEPVPVCGHTRDVEFGILVKMHAENTTSRWFFGFHTGNANTMIGSDSPALSYFGVQFSGTGLRGDTAARFVTSNGVTQNFQALSANPDVYGTVRHLRLKYTASTQSMEFFVDGVSLGVTLPGSMPIPTMLNGRPIVATIGGTAGRNDGLWLGTTWTFKCALPASYKV